MNRVRTENSKLSALLTAANQGYNDAPKASSRPREPKMVLFMGEADGYVATASRLSKREQVNAYKELAALSRTGEVAVTENAAAVLRQYGKSLGAAPVSLYAARLEY